LTTDSQSTVEGAADESPQPLYIVGLCSRGRPTLLERLLRSLDRQKGVAARRVEIVIIDNNPSPTIVAERMAAIAGFPVHVAHQPKTGLVHARNMLFDEVEARGAEWMIGIDDDEWVATDWLAQWIRASEEIPADIMVGKVAILHQEGGSLLSTYRQYRDPIAGEPATLLGTCNYAVNQRIFSKASGLGMRFDHHFNDIGGEDAEFMLRAKRKYDVIPFGWPHSHAFEERSGPRAKLGYMLKRTMQDRINTLMISRMHRKMGLMTGRKPFFFVLLRRTNKSLVFMLGHAVAGIALLPFQPRRAGRYVGRALEHFVQFIAVVPFYYGWRRRSYVDAVTDHYIHDLKESPQNNDSV